MKHICIFAIFIFICSAGYSQLTPARQLPPDVEYGVVIKAPFQEVFDYITVFDNLEEYAGSLVAGSEIQEGEFPVVRQIFFNDGSSRTERIWSVPQLKLIRVEVDESDEKYSKYMYSYNFAEVGKSKCKITINAYYSLKSGESTSTSDKEILAEIKSVLIGLRKHFKKNK